MFQRKLPNTNPLRQSFLHDHTLKSAKEVLLELKSQNRQLLKEASQPFRDVTGLIIQFALIYSAVNVVSNVYDGLKNQADFPELINNDLYRSGNETSTVSEIIDLSMPNSTSTTNRFEKALEKYRLQLLEHFKNNDNAPGYGDLDTSGIQAIIENKVAIFSAQIKANPQLIVTVDEHNMRQQFLHDITEAIQTFSINCINNFTWSDIRNEDSTINYEKAYSKVMASVNQCFSNKGPLSNFLIKQLTGTITPELLVSSARNLLLLLPPVLKFSFIDALLAQAYVHYWQEQITEQNIDGITTLKEAQDLINQLELANRQIDKRIKHHKKLTHIFAALVLPVAFGFYYSLDQADEKVGSSEIKVAFIWLLLATYLIPQLIKTIKQLKSYYHHSAEQLSQDSRKQFLIKAIPLPIVCTTQVNHFSGMTNVHFNLQGNVLFIGTTKIKIARKTALEAIKATFVKYGYRVIVSRNGIEKGLSLDSNFSYSNPIAKKINQELETQLVDLANNEQFLRQGKFLAKRLLAKYNFVPNIAEHEGGFTIYIQTTLTPEMIQQLQELFVNCHIQQEHEVLILTGNKPVANEHEFQDFLKNIDHKKSLSSDAGSSLLPTTESSSATLFRKTKKTMQDSVKHKLVALPSVRHVLLDWSHYGAHFDSKNSASRVKSIYGGTISAHKYFCIWNIAKDQFQTDLQYTAFKRVADDPHFANSRRGAEGIVFAKGNRIKIKLLGGQFGDVRVKGKLVDRADKTKEALYEFYKVKLSHKKHRK